MASDLEIYTCERCKRELHGGSLFYMKAGGGNAVKCLRCAVRHTPMLKTSLKTSLVVGTVLVALNQGDTIVAGQLSSALFWKIPLTYLVPFLVASWGALVNARR